tara:strand:+ start:369 stop:941 length:573 start_codon:yes stop_codon:yes gene_type:complete
MDRASKKVSEALKKLRKITGEIQSTFADSIGVSFPLVRGIENGVRDISHITANKISAATGCNAVALMKGRLLNREGKPYTKEDYKFHKSSDIDDGGYDLLADTLKAQCKAFEVLLSLPSARQKIYIFETLFNQFVQQATETLECGKEYDRLLIKQHGAIGQVLVNMRHGRSIKSSDKKAHPQPTITRVSS